MSATPSYYEFFAGGGMARAGLGPGWRCLFANDFDRKKAESYRANWGGAELHVGDVREVTTAQLPGQADLVWGSFPCQDLSLAGAGAGLKGERSGSFWPFWSLMQALRAEGRAPKTIVLENVCGALTSHGGKDFTAICKALAEGGYRYGALVIDAALFLPQSRPRLFIIALRDDIAAPAALVGQSDAGVFHTRALKAAHDALPKSLQQKWLWWRLPTPPLRNIDLANVIESKPSGVIWHSSAQTDALIQRMSEANQRKLVAAAEGRSPKFGTAFRRMRKNAAGISEQRTEIRFDGIAGCLRTPAGGSSRQILFVVDGDDVKSRLLSPREAARLMGLRDSYKLPARYSDALHLAGDGVVIHVVMFLNQHLLEFLVSGHEPIELANDRSFQARKIRRG